MPNLDFPYSIKDLLSGTVRVIYAPYSVTNATKLNDVFSAESPYATKTGWIDLGASSDSVTYERGMDSEEIEIEQTSGAVWEDITETTRTIELSIAEFKAEHVKILEEGEAKASITASAAAAGVGLRYPAGEAVDFGNISSLTAFRCLLVGQKKPQQGSTAQVTESDGTTVRGQFAGVYFGNVSLAAEDAEVEWEKGEIAHMPVTLRANPDPSNANRVGRWIFETGITIAA